MTVEPTMTITLTSDQYDTFLFMAGMASSVAVKEGCMQAARNIFDLVQLFQTSAIEAFYGDNDQKDAHSASHPN